MTAFHELPSERRMALRDAIEQAGGLVDSYLGPDVQVALPNTGFSTFLQAMAKVGLTVVPGPLFTFPLGTDSPPPSLRHDGGYPASRGFWLYGRFTPTI